MFYHEDSSGNGHKVYLKTLLPILVRPNWDRKGFKPSLIASLVYEIEIDGCSFYCNDCGEIISKKEVYCRCYHCNERISIEKAVSPNRSLGIYCKEHSKEFFEDEKPISVLEFLKKERE